MIPGANLLNMAFGLIQPQRVEYRRFSGRTTNAAGIEVVTWANPVAIFGSLQPVDHKLLQQYGLELNKAYMTFYATQGFREPDRNRAGDRITYGNRTYQVEGLTPWLLQDGWSRVLCVEVTNAPE